MSLAVLIQVHDEVRRLAIAGSAVAGGDFRLKKLIAPLEQTGAKAPVFARVAQAAQAVVDSNETTASAALLELASLTNAILYTQGETGLAGDLHPLETTDLGGHDTQTSARVLKPLLDALDSTGSGRLELVRDAVERGVFRDLRLVKPALNALDDPYPDIAELIAQKVLPVYGRAIVPHLQSTLDLKGRAGHVHRLRLLHKLDPEGSHDLVRRALDEGSRELRVVAIECLGTTGSDLSHLLEHAKAKAKDVRAAALRALCAAAASATEAVAAVKKAIEGADLELVVDQLKKSTLPEIRDYVLAQADRQLAGTLATKDPKEQGPAITRLQHLVLSLEGRTDANTEGYLLRCFDAVPALAKMKSTPSGQDFNELLAHVLARGTPTTRQRLVAAHKTLTVGMLPPALDAARQTMSPADFYSEFNSMLAGLKRKKGTEHDRAEALAGALASRSDWRYHRPWVGHEDDAPDDHDTRPELDPRWLDAAIDAGVVDLVCQLARPGHAKTNKFLAAQLEGTKPHEQHLVLETMVRIGHPDAADAIIESLKKQSKATHYGYFGYWYGRMIVGLPKAEASKFEALMPTLPEKMLDQLIESVMVLKNKE